MRRECRERFPRYRFQSKQIVNDPGMHHGTCVTHAPWCMSGSLIRCGGENVPGIPGAYATSNFTYLLRGPYVYKLIPVDFLSSGPLFTKRADVLQQDLMKSRSREIRVCSMSSEWHTAPLLSYPDEILDIGFSQLAVAFSASVDQCSSMSL